MGHSDYYNDDDFDDDDNSVWGVNDYEFIFFSFWGGALYIYIFFFFSFFPPRKTQAGTVHGMRHKNILQHNLHHKPKT